jgi:signal transduction histidine kinase
MLICFKKFGLSFVCFLFLAFFSTIISCSDNSSNVNNDIHEWNKKIAKVAVHNHAVMIGSVISDYNNDSDRIHFIRKSIESIRFYDDNSGYFYVYSVDCINIAHATQKDLLGKNLYDFQDTRGKFVIRELSYAAINGGGFVEYYWIKPGETGEKKKLGYVELIPNTNYFIGSGVYL